MYLILIRTKGNIDLDMMNIVFFTFFLLLVQSGVLVYFIFKIAIRPLDDILDWVKAEDYTEPVKIPELCSEDIVSIYHVINDSLSRMNKANKDLISSEKNNAVSITVQMVAHEVRRPLTQMQALISLCRKKKSESAMDLIEKHLPKIDNTLKTADSLLTDVQSFGQHLNLNIAHHALDRLILESLNGVFTARSRKMVHFKYSFCHSLHLKVDRVRIISLLTNIISNAYEEMDSNCLINFSVKKCGVNDYIDLQIHNTGSFIPPEEVDNIFDLFYTKKVNGNGLGLPMCRKIARAHGGDIFIQSSQDFGTTFTVRLPTSDKQLATAVGLPSTNLDISFKTPSANKVTGFKPEHSKDISQFEKSILIVDDEEIYRNALKNNLESISRKIHIFESDGNGCLETLLRENQVNLGVAVIDLDLGDGYLDGYSLIKTIKKDYPKSIVCIHSNHNSAHHRNKTLELGADLFLPKPASKDHLEKIIRMAQEKVI